MRRVKPGEANPEDKILQMVPSNRARTLLFKDASGNIYGLETEGFVLLENEAEEKYISDFVRFADGSLGLPPRGYYKRPEQR